MDFGFKRIGVAVGEWPEGVVGVRPALTASGTLKRDASALAEIAKREKTDVIVVGIPMNPAGDDGMERICQALAGELSNLGLKVATVDESLTSLEAEEALVQIGMKSSRRKKTRDAESAARILERYFREQANA